MAICPGHTYTRDFVVEGGQDMSRGVTIATAVVVVLACWLGIAGAASAQAGCARAAALPKAATLAQSDDAVLCLINAERARHGLRALRASSPLYNAAVAHSSDMVAEDYFDHVSPDGKTARQRVLSSGYFRRGAGEVDEALALGWQQRATPRELVRALMASQQHRSILLDRRNRDVGVGLVLGAPTLDMPGGATLTLDFARR
jgi:uncharacterized protein YkwD